MTGRHEIKSHFSSSAACLARFYSGYRTIPHDAAHAYLTLAGILTVMDGLTLHYGATDTYTASPSQIQSGGILIMEHYIPMLFGLNKSLRFLLLI